MRPVLGGDSPSYLAAATDLTDLSGWRPGYIGYLAILWLGVRLGSAAWFAVVFQSLAMILAAAALLSLGRQFAGSIAGWAAAAILLIHPLVAQWTRYVLTEPLFFAGIVSTAWCCIKLAPKPPARWWPIAAVALPTAALRPNGVVVPAAAVTFLLLTRHLRGRWAFVAATWFAATVVIVVLGSHGSAGQQGSQLATSTWAGETISAHPELRIDVPPPNAHEPTTAAFAAYILRHPFVFVKLAATRIGWELVQVRPWYSRALNAYIAVSMAGFYCAAAMGWWLCRRSDLNRMTWTVSLPFIAVIGLTWAIHEGRFAWWFLVMWSVWAGVGGQHAAVRLKRVLSANLERRRV